MSWLNGRLPADLEWKMVPTPDRPDLIMDLRLPRWLAARGAKVNFLIRNNDQQRRVRIAIPAWVKDGTCLRVKGGGRNVGMRQGHLYINIRLKD
jgi:DnaJ-class molecular chaperone